MNNTLQWFGILFIAAAILAITFDMGILRRERRHARHLARLAERLGSEDRASRAVDALARLRSKERVL
jgi:hypothetical protein